ncbi:hypothetical protein ACWCQZ_49140 [Streptomyces sp. NPDC002285]
MIHGTWGWKGDWWRPEADFHQFILSQHRRNLYNRGARFSWSGMYRASHRDRAAVDFCEWANDLASAGLQTVFAHSYGGEVAARAILKGARLSELVLLSVPATRYVKEAVGRSNLRVVDVRLRFDPVLALARTRQKIQHSNVTPVVLRDWRLGHGATHKRQVWLAEDVAGQGGL